MLFQDSLAGADFRRLRHANLNPHASSATDHAHRVQVNHYPFLGNLNTKGCIVPATPKPDSHSNALGRSLYDLGAWDICDEDKALCLAALGFAWQAVSQDCKLTSFLESQRERERERERERDREREREREIYIYIMYIYYVGAPYP